MYHRFIRSASRWMTLYALKINTANQKVMKTFQASSAGIVDVGQHLDEDFLLDLEEKNDDDAFLVFGGADLFRSTFSANFLVSIMSLNSSTNASNSATIAGASSSNAGGYATFANSTLTTLQSNFVTLNLATGSGATFAINPNLGTF